MRTPETKMSPATAATARGTKAQLNECISIGSGTSERTPGPEARRALKQARRALGAALAQGEPHPDLVAAAGLVIEAGRSQ
ncbi:hypothetical protein GCM10029992_12190 [Glycomyces albus]